MSRFRRTKLVTPGVEPQADPPTDPTQFDPRHASIHQPIGLPQPGTLYPTDGLPYPNPDVPAPTLTALVPASVIVGEPDFTLSVQGTGFGPASVILWNGAQEPTTFVSDTELTTGVNMATVTGPASIPVQVVGEGGVTAALTFEIVPPV